MNPINRGLNFFNQVGNKVQKELSKAQNAVEGAVNTVSNTVQQGVQQAARVVDGFESVATRGAQALNLSGGRRPPDTVHDGHFVGASGRTYPPGTPLNQMAGVKPANNPNPTKTILYVNGIMTPKEAQSEEMQAIANRTGANIVGIHNSTQGFIKDLTQCVGDKLDKGRNPAVDTLADTLYSELKAGREVHLMGYSQGGLITSRALKDVARRLRIEDGMSQSQVEQTMGRLSVETFGAAAATYPNGPQYVHYVNNADMVPTLFGLGPSLDPAAFLRDAGKGAVVHHFTDGNLNLVGNHKIDSMYMKHRVPFEEARAGRF